MCSKILVAIDRSPNSRIVFDQALTLAKITRASLMLLHVLSSEETGSPLIPTLTTFEYVSVKGEPLENYWKQWQTYEEQGLGLLRSYSNEAVDVGVNSEFIQTSGSPGREICAVAQTWGADLIAIGRQGHSGWNELVLGSVSNAVFHKAPCSVYVVHIPAILKPQAPVSKPSQEVHYFEAKEEESGYEPLIEETIAEEFLSNEELADVSGGVANFNHFTHPELANRSTGREGNILEPGSTFPTPPRPEDFP